MTVALVASPLLAVVPLPGAATSVASLLLAVAILLPDLLSCLVGRKVVKGGFPAAREAQLGCKGLHIGLQLLVGGAGLGFS